MLYSCGVCGKLVSRRYIICKAKSVRAVDTSRVLSDRRGIVCNNRPRAISAAHATPASPAEPGPTLCTQHLLRPQSAAPVLSRPQCVTATAATTLSSCSSLTNSMALDVDEENIRGDKTPLVSLASVRLCGRDGTLGWFVQVENHSDLKQKWTSVQEIV